MSSDNKADSQEDLDTMLSGLSYNGRASSGESEPPARTAAEAPAAPAPTAPLETLGAAVERIAQLERGLTEITFIVRLIQHHMQTMTDQVNHVSSRVEGNYKT